MEKARAGLLLVYVSLLIVSLALPGCGKEELSRKKAQEIISAVLKPQVKSYTYGAVTHSKNYDFNKSDKALEEAGLITIRFVRDIDKFMDIGLGTRKNKIKISTSKLYEVKLTQLGREYLLKEEVKPGVAKYGMEVRKGTFKLADFKLKEIVDIQDVPEKGGAIVKFVLTRKKTPFWALRSIDLAKGSPPEDEIEHTVLIRKTDEGWKL